MQSKMQSGGAGCSISCRGSIEGLSIEWGEKGERVKMELIARIPQGMAMAGGFKRDLRSHQRRHDIRVQGAPESLGRSLPGGKDIMQWRPSPTLESRNLVSGEASHKLSRRSLWSQDHPARALMLHVVPCTAEFMISQQEPLEPSEAKPPFPSAFQRCSIILLALPLNPASPTRASMRLTRPSGNLHPRHSSVGVHAYQESAAS